jgi:CDP-glycerol glycerophosphotransferase
MFLDGANRLLEDAPDAVFADLRAIDRLEWHLLRRRKLEELVEVVRFHREEMGEHPPIRRGLRWYGAYPYRDDPALAIPEHVYRLGRSDSDLTLRIELEGVRRAGERLELHGLAYVIGFGAPRRYSQRVRFSLLAPGGRLRRLRLRVGAIGLPTTRVHRTDVAPKLAWAGFKVTLDPAELQARTGDATWELSTHVLTRGLSRRRTKFWLRSPEFARTVGLPAPGGGLVDVSTDVDGTVRVRSREHWAAVHEARLEGAEVVLEGDARMPAGTPERVEAHRESDAASFTVDVAGDARRFAVRIPLALVRDAPESPERAAGAPDVADTWALTLHGPGGSLPLVLDADTTRFTALEGGHGISLESKRWGDAVLVDRLRHPWAGPPPPAPAAPQRSSPAGA